MKKLLVALLICCAPAMAHAATVTVGTGGNYSTIQGALNSGLSAGDVVSIIEAKTYAENLSLPVSGTSGNPIILRNDSGGVATVQATSGTIALNLNGKSYWTISGLNITYAGSGTSPSVVDGTYSSYISLLNNTFTMSSGNGAGYGVRIMYSDHLTIQGNTIAIVATTGGIFTGAVFLFDNNVEFSGNTLYGNASETTGRLVDGMAVSGQDINIENNIIHDGWSFDNHPDGVVVQGDGDRYGSHTANVNVVRNTIYNFTQGVYFDAIHNPLEGTNLVANNVIYETSAFRYGGLANKMNAIVLDGESLGGPYYAIAVSVYNNTTAAKQLALYVTRTGTGTVIDVKNNIWVNPGYTNVYISSTTGVTMDYNCFSNSDSTPIRWGGTAYTLSSFRLAGYGETHGTPVGTSASFMDAANFNFHLASNDTVATGKGTNLSSYFTTDRDGNTRVSWDIGAYKTGTLKYRKLRIKRR